MRRISQQLKDGPNNGISRISNERFIYLSSSREELIDRYHLSGQVKFTAADIVQDIISVALDFQPTFTLQNGKECSFFDAFASEISNVVGFLPETNL